MMVKPICSEPRSAASSGEFALLDVAGDVLDHDDGVVDHEARRDRQRHQRQVVEAEARKVHDAEGADQRQRHRQARDDGGAGAAQEHEDHQHHEHDGEHQLEFDVLDRGADGHGAVAEHRDVDRRRQRRLQLRQQALDVVDHLDDVGAGLALDVENDRGGRRFIQAASLVFCAPSTAFGDVAEPHRRAVAVGDDEVAIAVPRSCSWSLALMVVARIGPSKLPFGVLTLALPSVVRRSSMLSP